MLREPTEKERATWARQAAERNRVRQLERDLETARRALETRPTDATTIARLRYKVDLLTRRESTAKRRVLAQAGVIAELRARPQAQSKLIAQLRTENAEMRSKIAQLETELEDERQHSESLEARLKEIGQ